MMMRLAETARVLGGQLHGGDAAFDAVATDTRTIRRGDLFIALKGERFDAHAFVAQAADAGAAAAVVEHASDAPLPQIVVGNTLDALATLRPALARPLRHSAHCADRQQRQNHRQGNAGGDFARGGR